MISKRLSKKSCMALTLIIFVTSIIMGPTSFVFAAPAGQWTEVQTVNQPENRERSGITRDSEGNVYLIGGWDSVNQTRITAITKYDSNTGKYTKLGDLPVPLAGSKAFTFTTNDSKSIFIFGGSLNDGNPISTVYPPATNSMVYRFDLLTNTCEEVGPAPFSPHFMGAALNRGYVYFYGGQNTDRLMRFYMPGRTWEVLDTVSSRGSSVVFPVGFQTSDNKIHFYGGRNDSTMTYYNNVVTYDLTDPNNPTFSTDVIPAYGTPKWSAARASIDGGVTWWYLIGGSVGTTPLSEMISYNYSTKQWQSEAPLPYATQSPMVVNTNGKIHFFYQGKLYMFDSELGTGPLTLNTSISGQLAAYLTSCILNPAQVTLTGNDSLKATYTTSPWSITDARGNGNGWYVTMSASTPVSQDGKTIALNYLRVLVSNIMKAQDAQTSSDPAKIIPANGVTLEQPATVVSAKVYEGMGSFNFTPSLEMQIPANSYAGNYNSTIYTSMYQNGPII